MKKIYIVIIGEGEYEDYYENHIFASFDNDKVIAWKDRFNKIIKGNYERIRRYYNDDNYSKKNLFWHDYIAYSNPQAFIKEVEFKE